MKKEKKKTKKFIVELQPLLTKLIKLNFKKGSKQRKKLLKEVK